MTNTWNMDILFSNSAQIAQKLDTLLRNHGYQTVSRSEAHYLSTGVNWGYTSTQLDENLDPTTAGILLGVLLLILLTGYLIIYNVFQISVTTDIRFYGLLKTIGTTGKQLRRIIRGQVLILSLMGFPLVCFWVISLVHSSPLLSCASLMVSLQMTCQSVLGFSSALFSLCTVLISCLKPARMAGRVSAIEAVRYTDSGTHSRKTERRTRGAKLSTWHGQTLDATAKKRHSPSPHSRLQPCCFSSPSPLPTALIWINIWQIRWSVTLSLQIPAIFNPLCSPIPKPLFQNPC